MRYSEIEKRRGRKLGPALNNYKMCYYLEYDYSFLGNILSRKKNGSRSPLTYSECYIMLDTETSKERPTQYKEEYDSKKKVTIKKAIPQINHICAFTCSIRAFHTNIVTLYGSRPSELVHMLELIRANIKGDMLYVFCHNLPFDWFHIRRFMIEHFGKPEKQLNIKNHYPLTIQFSNGLVLRDSLILAGVSLEKWAQNLGVQQKAVGFWDYDEIRNQNHKFTKEELKYIECDTLAGVECLNKLADNLGDTVVSLPFTNTGIVRRRIRKIGRNCFAKQIFNKQLITIEELEILEKVFHGGFVHSNRALIGWQVPGVKCYDFKSSYPFCMLTTKVPSESFIHLDGVFTIEQILNNKTNAYIFKLVLVKPRLRDINFPMPVLQFYKCESSINAVCDNGRILAADYVEIYINEIDARMIQNIYTYDECYCVDVMAAYKDFIPKWYRDAVFDIFKEKCEVEYKVKIEKTVDSSVYGTIKSMLNSLYGMAVTKPIKPDIIECYDDSEKDDLISGDYYIDNKDMKKKFNKYLTDRNNILPYVWGIYTTSAAMYNLFKLSSCIDDINRNWVYSDTDSIYSSGWNNERLAAFNEGVKNELINAGYGPVNVNGREYWLGVAELDGGPYDNFITQGAKRYAMQNNGEIKITVAGVPKKAGANVLRSLDDFCEGFIFPGTRTGKKTHTYIPHEIFIDENGNECADSIDLTPADYTLSCVDRFSFDDLFNEVIYYDWFEEE